MSRAKLYRDPHNGYIAGVCAGLAEYFGWNVKLVRALVIVGFICGGGAPILIAYAIAWYVFDPVPAGAYARDFGDGTPAYGGGGPGVSMTDLKARFARLDERLRGIEECVTSNEFELRREFRKLES